MSRFSTAITASLAGHTASAAINQAIGCVKPRPLWCITNQAVSATLASATVPR